MGDERWATQDKLTQLRGVIGLFNNTKSNNKNKITTLCKKQSKDIKNLTTQNKKYRRQYEEVLNGDKQKILPVLHSHPKMELAFKNLNPQRIEEELKQSIFCKNKELDRLRYKRMTLEQNFLNKKLELADAQKEAEDAPENYLWEQEITNKIQSISVKQNAARTNRHAFEKARNILKNDAIRFDEILDGLKNDLAHQSENIVKAVELGQNVAEELSMLQREYSETEKAVRNNMKQRDRAIRSLKTEIENVRQNRHSSIRESQLMLLQHPPTLPGHSAVHLTQEENEATQQEAMDQDMKREIALTEKTLNQIKEAAAVHRVQDIVPRLQEQKRQNERLMKQVKENEEQLNKMLELRNQLDVMREVVLYHTMTEEAIQMKEERNQLRNDMDGEKEDMEKAHEELLDVGQKILNVRTAVLSMNLMLDTVYTGEISTLELPLGGLSVNSDTIPGGGLQPLIQPNMDALTLMEQVIKKVRWLLEQAAYVSALPSLLDSQYAMDYGVSKAPADEEADNIVSSMLEDMEEMDDQSVLTRKDIKAESKRLVDLHDDPRSMFQESSLPKFKKHKCF